MSLGPILLSQGVLSAEQLDEASREQQRAGERLEQTVARLGFASSEQVMRALSEELALPFVRLDETELEDEALQLVPPRIVFKLRAMPVRIRAGRLLVATSDPMRLDGFEELRIAAGIPVDLAVAEEHDIGARIRARFGVAGDVLDALGATVAAPDARQESGEPDDASEASVVRLVNDLLYEAIRERATDIHIEPYERELHVRYRIDGVLCDAGVPATIHRFRNAITSRLKIMANLNIAEKRRPQDGRITLRHRGANGQMQEYDLRLSVIPMLYGEGVVLRILAKNAVLTGLEELGMPERVLAPWLGLVARPHGIVLVTGPTGSGKSTTLYASLRQIVTGEVKAITVEDPVEYHVPGVNQIQVNHQVGLDFAAGLRAILRHDPDIIMIGEIRDAETANAAVQASLTGHLVLSTLHTNDACGAATRLLDMGVEPFLVASTVEGVLAQRLLRRVCRACATMRPPHEGEIPPGFLPVGEHLVAAASGCRDCRNSGYRGRIGCYELLQLDEAVRGEIMRRASADRIGAAAHAGGRLTTLAEAASELVLRGVTTPAEALAIVA